ELHIGGVGLALGYLNRPELTAEKFILNPFSDDKSQRLYKTGDYARYLPDGNIEFLGRIDHQVKIRGYRLELGEIETTLNQHPGVKQTVAIAREDVPGDKRLVAYVVLKSEPITNINELREFLLDKLPEYKIPSAFVVLETIPLTPNGKIDRKALPQLTSLRPKIKVDFMMPQNETEKTISKIWQKALQLEQVGIDDNFFELGGHSLILIEIHKQLEEIFGKQISIVELFQFPTIKSLARRLTQKPSIEAAEKKEKLAKLSSDRSYAMRKQRERRLKYRQNS
ncbi:MAG: non-ribosomal peptide synthetase, partial [Waterburya sp.]